MKSRYWARLSVILNLVGFLFLYYSFQTASTKIEVVRNTTTTALCADGRAMVALGKDGSAVIASPEPYKPCSNGKPAAIVNTDLPILGKIGFACIIASLFAQWKAS